MGRYLNLGNAGFQSIRKGLYIDKSGLIAFINRTLGTKDKLTCVSRPRRFGKSFASQMLCAYYDKSCDSKELFQGLEITNHPDCNLYMNQYNVIYLHSRKYPGHRNLSAKGSRRGIIPDVYIHKNRRLFPSGHAI